MASCTTASPTLDGIVNINGIAVPKRYKPSRFNAHTVDYDGAVILYNSYRGHQCVIPASAATRLERYLTQEGFFGVLDNLGSYLLDKGYIVESSINEMARLDVRYGQHQFRQDRLELILLSSEDCNFRCIYCSQEFKRGIMQPAVRRGVRKLVEGRIGHVRSMHIDWFGGEPMLGYEVMEELAPFFQEITARHDVQYTSGMTTNAYLLTPERSRNLVKWGVVGYQITLDGAAPEHDTHRPLEGGGATFNTILENVSAMTQYPETFEVALRVNFDNRNVHHMQALFEILKDRVGSDPRFSIRFHPVGKWGGPNDEDLDTCTAKETSRHLVQLNTKAKAAGLNVESGWGLDPSPASVCYAARPYHFVVGSDGKLMKCTVVLDTQESNVVGQLFESGEVRVNEDRFAQWVQPFYQHDEVCRKCFFVPVCQGAICPLPRVTDGERPCPSQKVEIQQTLKDMRAQGVLNGRPRPVLV